MIEVKHTFQSSKGDGSDTSLVKPSDWNAIHSFEVTGPALLGKIASGAGAVEEVPIGEGLSFTDGILVTTMRALPVGVMFPLAGSYEPPGWFICDGRAVSRTVYNVLFDITGDKFGVGDGVTTFNIPDMRGRVPAGKDNMGGTAANRLTLATFPTGATDIGKTAGTENHILTLNQLAKHAHHPVVADHWHYTAAEIDANDSSPQPLTFEWATARRNSGAGESSYMLHGVDAFPTGGWTGYPEYEEGVNAVVIDETGLDEPHLNLPPMLLFSFIVFHGVYPT